MHACVKSKVVTYINLVGFSFESRTKYKDAIFSFIFTELVVLYLIGEYRLDIL